ncbi:MAG: twin-arginine translocase TatA/TatE family subunit [Rikenellaceae bacterium]
MNLLFIGSMGAPEMILIVLGMLLLFGGTKLPELMRGAGRGIREFKDAMNGSSDKDDKKSDEPKSESEEK